MCDTHPHRYALALTHDDAGYQQEATVLETTRKPDHLSDAQPVPQSQLSDLSASSSRAEVQPPLENVAPIMSSGLDGGLYMAIGYADINGEYQDSRAVSLRNLGNTCYLNALLYATARVPSERQWTV